MVFGANKGINGTYTVVFGTNTVVIGTNAVVFGTNTVVFGTYTSEMDNRLEFGAGSIWTLGALMAPIGS